MMRVGLVGVGAMGMNVARALRRRGFPVTVRDLVQEREREASTFGCEVAPSPRALAGAVDVVITLVVDASDTREVLSSLPHDGPPVMMCSTIAPAMTEALAAGRRLLDAPVSGGPVRARAGELTVMAAGEDSVYMHCGPVLAAMASRVFRVGARPGDGSRMKVVNNMLAAANLAAGAEALAMAAMLGLDVPQASEVIQASSGASWIFGDRMPRALAGDTTVNAATRVLTKDVGLFVHEARRLGLTATMAEAAHAIFQDAVQRGLAEADDGALLERYAQAWPDSAKGLRRS